MTFSGRNGAGAEYRHGAVAADDPAARFGIAANIEFPLPASFIWDMFVRVLKDIPGESAFSKQSMSWKLMTLLPQHRRKTILSCCASI